MDDRVHPRIFLRQESKDHASTDVFATRLDEKLDQDFDMDSATRLKIDVTKILLKECREAQTRDEKVDITILIYRFILFYPGIFDSACNYRPSIETVVYKLKELAVHRNITVRGRPFLGDETAEMIRRLTEKNIFDLASLLVDDGDVVMIPL